MKEDIELVEVLEIIKDQLEILAEEKNNKIVVEVEENVKIFADYDRLVQILINITKNSIQFTENGTIACKGKRAIKKRLLKLKIQGSELSLKK